METKLDQAAIEELTRPEKAALDEMSAAVSQLPDLMVDPDPREGGAHQIIYQAADDGRILTLAFMATTDDDNDSAFVFADAICKLRKAAPALIAAAREVEQLRAELATTREQLAQQTKNYYDLADAVCRESVSVEDACRQARETREQLRLANADAEAMRAALDNLLRASNEGDCSAIRKASREAEAMLSHPHPGQSIADRLKAEAGNCEWTPTDDGMFRTSCGCIGNVYGFVQHRYCPSCSKPIVMATIAAKGGQQE